MLNRRAWGRLAVLFAGLLVTSSCSLINTNNGTAPADFRVSLAFGLDRDQPALARFVEKVGNPKHPRYRKFLSVKQNAKAYGADPKVVNDVTTTLRQAGFEGRLEPSGGLIVGTFSVADAEQFFGVAMNQTTDSNGRTTIDPSGDLVVPASIAAGVTQVYGGRATVKSMSASSSSAASGTPPCPPKNQSRANLTSVLGDLYGITDLRRAGLTGEGVRVGLLEVDTYSAHAMKLYSQCYGVPSPPVDVVSANATAEQLRPTSEETSLDLVALSWAAPGLSQATLIQFDGHSSLIFPLARVMSLQSKANESLDVLSTSVTFCESDLSGDELQMTEWLLMSAAATGLTTMSASGDRGSSGCYPDDTSAKSQYPSASPHTTSIGGTQLSGFGTQDVSQTVWNEGTAQGFAGGGGASLTFAKPAYQSKTNVPGSMRQLPDIAFLASPENVGPIAVCDPSRQCDFRTLAGTSATAPGVAGALALLIEQERQRGANAQFGLLNGALYELAESSNSQAIFQDVTKGDNDLFDIGCCSASVGYDMASGWGSLKFDKFAKYVAGTSEKVKS